MNKIFTLLLSLAITGSNFEYDQSKVDKEAGYPVERPMYWDLSNYNLMLKYE
jgi:hypothetical protein